MGRKAFKGSELFFQTLSINFYKYWHWVLDQKKFQVKKNESEKSLAWKKFLGSENQPWNTLEMY